MNWIIWMILSLIIIGLIIFRRKQGKKNIQEQQNNQKSIDNPNPDHEEK